MANPKKAPVKVKFQGKLIDGIELDFKIVKEDWNIYELEDGTILKFKPVMVKVTRINEYNKQGEPIYIFNTQNVSSPSVPEKLLKEEKSE